MYGTSTGTEIFWCRGYCIDTVGKNTKAIAAYIQKQLAEDVKHCQPLYPHIDCIDKLNSAGPC